MPLILTLQLDAESHEYFDRLRCRHFPPELNFIAAHVTLFHALPDREFTAITEALRTASAIQPALPIQVSGLRNLGRGVAFQLQSPALIDLRQSLAKQWHDWLTPQDRQKFQPHVTVQNKVLPEIARETLALLKTAATPDVTGMGLQLWKYRSGPWEQLVAFPFAKTNS